MRILFICGSLEPGKDGVGDYTRLLAKELATYGVSVYLIAINDQYVSSSTLDEETYHNMNIVRIPRSVKWSNRKRLLVKIKSFFKPDLISVQYVPYSYSGRGIPFQFMIYIGRFLSLENVHLMVHEPYLNIRGKLYQYLISYSQILSLKYLKFILKKATWNTSIVWYQKLLKDIGIRATLTPIFGNIRKVALPIKYKSLFERELNTKYLFFFASLPSINYWEFYFRGLNEYLSRNNEQLCLVFCGRVSNEGTKFKEFLRFNLPRNRVSIIDFGELASDHISWLLQNCDCGVSRVPARLIGKSGAAVAMVEHGLPVWAPILENNDYFEVDCESIVGARLEDLLVNGRRKSKDFLKETVHVFLSDVNRLRSYDEDEKSNYSRML